MNVCDWLLGAAATLVPASLRHEWLREWRAEVAWATCHAARRPTTRSQRAALVLRCCGAFSHAVWLRWNHWRVDMLVQDIRYAWRGLVKRPGFLAIAVCTLALGIGANAAIYSALRAVLLRPLPFPAPEQLVQISSTTMARPTFAGGAASPPDFVDWRTQSTAIAEMAAISAGSIPWSGHGAAEQVPHAMVTGGFFDVMGVAPRLGRAIGTTDDPLGSEDVVVISHALWTRRLGGDPSIVGRTMTLDGTPRRIVGVMPEGFAYPLGSELWVPLRFTPDDLATQRGAHYLEVVGRLAPDASLERAQAELSAIVERLAEAYPSTNRDKRIAVIALRDAIVGDVRPALFVLFGAVGFVLLIVCVNVASLTMTRAIGRTRELAVRTALGASRGRLANGLLAESVLVAAAGAAAGLLLAYWATQAIAAFDSGLGIPLLDQTRIDASVVAFTAVTAVVSALLFGALPAWHAAAGLDVARRIREDAGTSTGSRERQRLRRAMIVAETAMAVVLLIGAGLLMRSFLRMSAVDLGIDTSRVQTFTISLPEAKYPTPASRAAFVDTLVSRLSARGDVEAAGAVFGLPLSNVRYGISTSTVDGRRLSDEEQDRLTLQVRVATPDYFRAMGIPLIRGRSFGIGDRLGAAPVVVINEAAADLLWPGEDALGRHFTIGTRMGQGGDRVGGHVVGIAANVRDFGPTVAVRPTVYLAHAQVPIDFVSVVIKARHNPAALVEPARAVVAELDPDLPMFRVRTMEQLAANTMAQPRLYMLLVGLFAAAAALLAALGIYGVLMHAVSQRSREIGIRIALGAPRSGVVGAVVGQAALLAGSGLAIGLVLAFGAAWLGSNLLFGIQPLDVLTYAAVAGLLFAAALLASYVPARRAARVDPVRALRFE